MSNLWTDLRYALRQLRKSPGFAALAIATLAIGIGASTAIYSIVDGVLLRSLPYSHPQQLISLFESLPGAPRIFWPMKPSCSPEIGLSKTMKSRLWKGRLSKMKVFAVATE